MKKNLLILALAVGGSFLLTPAQAETALGLTEAEMTALYGKDFAKQAIQAREMMDEDWNEDLDDDGEGDDDDNEPEVMDDDEDDGEEEPSTLVKDSDSDKKVSPITDPAGAMEKATEKAGEKAVEKAGEAAKDPAKAADKTAKEAAKAAKAARARLLDNTVTLIKTKRSVDAKIKSSRNNIDIQRSKIATISKKLDKKDEKAKENNPFGKWGDQARKFAEQNGWGGNGGGGFGRGGNGGFGGFGGGGNNNNAGRGGKGNNGRGGKGGWGKAAEPKASNLDRQTVKNAQKSIKQHKAAIPELLAFSNELAERIDAQIAKLGKVDNAVIRGYDPDNGPEKEGCEAEEAAEDTYKCK